MHSLDSRNNAVIKDSFLHNQFIFSFSLLLFEQLLFLFGFDQGICKSLIGNTERNQCIQRPSFSNHLSGVVDDVFHTIKLCNEFKFNPHSVNTGKTHYQKSKSVFRDEIFLICATQAINIRWLCKIVIFNLPNFGEIFIFNDLCVIYCRNSRFDITNNMVVSFPKLLCNNARGGVNLFVFNLNKVRNVGDRGGFKFRNFSHNKNSIVWLVKQGDTNLTIKIADYLYVCDSNVCVFLLIKSGKKRKGVTH